MDDLRNGILDRASSAASDPTMKMGVSNIHPVGLVFAALNLIVGILAVAMCAYGLWSILTDLSHFTFVRGVVSVFCVYLGALSVATTIHRIRVWRAILSVRP